MARPSEAEETIQAIHQGNVDALVVNGPAGPQIVMLQNAEQPYRVLVERMSDGALTLGADDRILYANQRLADLSDVPVDALIGRSFASLFDSLDLTGAENGEATARLKNGVGGTPVSVWISSIFIGGVAAKLVTITDQTVQERIEAVVSAERFSRSILEQSTEAIIVLGSDGRITHASLVAEEIAVRPPIGARFSEAFRVVGKDFPVAERLDLMLATKPFHGVEVTMQNGSRRPRAFLLSAGQLLDETKSAIGSIVTLTDITARKQAEERQRVLVAELNHRVKNILAVVQAISAQTVRTSPSLPSYNTTFAGRVQALAVAHDILTRTQWSGIGLNELLQNVLSPYFGASQDHRIKLSGPPVLLPARTVVPLSMAMHELATNASKYGALSCPQGSVHVDWNVARNGTTLVDVCWAEKDGPRLAAGKFGGFGTTLIRRVVGHDLGGTVELDFASNGLRSLLKFPLTAHGELNDLIGGAQHS
ncbi:MAG: PAS domain S-box protein [Hyphomicrobiales bacterium]|nr:MAG: PAS domain S-box protein [Hyphomicrobiales bacterium]